MADYKVVDTEKLDADLKSVADAIRNKSGISAVLDFPTDFIRMIHDISGSSTPTGNIEITANGEYDVTEFVKAIVNVPIPAGAKYYASQLKPSADTHNASFNVGFEPKLFVIATVNSFANNSTTTYYIATFWHCADLTGAGYGEYSGGLTIYKDSLSQPLLASYDARSCYSYSNGVVTINDTAHYFRGSTLYRIFAMT